MFTSFFSYESLGVFSLVIGLIALGGIFLAKGERIGHLIGFLFFLSLSLFSAFQMQKETTMKKEMDTEERNTHSNLLLLPEGRYILDRIVSTDSTKVRFTLQLPGVAKRKVEVIAYDDSPTVYWNEWQAESAVPGDTLIICDVWNTDSTYSRVVQKMDASQVGWGYLSFEWLERPGWRKR